MGNWSFDIAHKGYLKEQVDSYMRLLEDNYQELVETKEKLAKEEANLTKMLEGGSYEDEDTIKQKNSAVQKQRKLEVLTKEGEKKLAEIQANTEEITLLEEKLESLKAIELNKKPLVEVRENDEPEYVQDELSIKAREQANVYIVKFKQEVDAENKEKLSVAYAELENVYEEAKRIKDDVKNSKLEEVDQEISMLSNDQDILAKEQEAFRMEYEYIKREAELESNALKLEASKILQYAKGKLDMVKMKEKEASSRAISEIDAMSQMLISEYKTMQYSLSQVIKEIEDGVKSNPDVVETN
ncbi:MAG: hypothetical protein ACK5LL_13530 [Suipraeoptans sp.]